MAPERPLPPLALARSVCGLALVLASTVAWTQTTKPGPGIYTCEVNGKKMTQDRPIPECFDREQKLLNPDGSLRKVIPPSMTADERAAAEQRERDAQAAIVARQDATRRDRNLMARFPNEAAHAKAREAALDDVRTAVRLSEARVKLLEGERKKLDEEAEFYPGKSLPPKLRSQIDANEAAQAAQRTLIQNQETEFVRINRLYDGELERLKKLWTGVPAGSMGAPPGGSGGPSPGGTPKKALEASASTTKTR